MAPADSRSHSFGMEFASVVGVALVAQVHRLLQRLTGGLCLFAHLNQSFTPHRGITSGWFRGLEPIWRTQSAQVQRGVSAARVLTTETRRGWQGGVRAAASCRPD